MKTIEQHKIDLMLKVLAGDLDKEDIWNLPVNDELRSFVCSLGPVGAYFYACYVDKCPREDTREICSRETNWKYCYACYVDKTIDPLRRL